MQPTARLANIGRVESDVLYFPSEPEREAEMDPDERIAVAAELLVQSPPGEINDVLNGLSDLPALLCSSQGERLQISAPSSTTMFAFKGG